MSKVYSFRLDENNPREVQARGVINAWVSKGYSLRQIIIDALIEHQVEDKQNYQLEDLLRNITHLLEAMNKGKNSTRSVQEDLAESFVSSISKSAKKGIKIE